MQLFDFNPQDYSQAYATDGFVHIPQGLSKEFFGVLTRQVEAYLQGEKLANFALGDKQQSLYQFPEEGDCFGQLLDSIQGICGLSRDLLVLSERHIKAYDLNANPNPLAHKDRYASEVSVGFSVNVPSGSKLVLYPCDEVSVNPYNSSAELRSSLSAEQVPEVTLRNARPVEIADAPRDVMMFRGNAIWHLRSQPAGTTMVYLKLNTFNCDPLGEDPRTPVVREKSHHWLAASDQLLATLVPRLGRRVDFVQERYTRQWQSGGTAVLWGAQHVPLDSWELELLRSIDGRRTIGSIMERFEQEPTRTPRWEKLRHLVQRDVIELTSPMPSPFTSEVAVESKDRIDHAAEFAVGSRG